MIDDTQSVRIHGAFEVENFGDILLTRIFSDWVRDAGWRPCVVDAPAYVQRELLLDAHPTGNPQAVLMVGGGYLGEPNRRTLIGRWRWGSQLIDRHLRVLEEARSCAIPYAVVGAGFGPISNVIARRRAVELLNEGRVTVVRDPESARWAARYGARVDDVTVDAALALADTEPTAAAVAEGLRVRQMADGRPIVAVQLNQTPDSGAEWLALYEILTHRLRGKDCFLLGISDQAGTPTSRTHKMAADAFLEGFQHSKFEPYVGIDSLLGRLRVSDLVITSKLHIGIVATAFGRPVLSLPTHQKTIRFYRQIGRQELCVPKGEWTRGAIGDAFDMAYTFAGAHIPVPDAPRIASLSNKKHVRTFLQSLC